MAEGKTGAPRGGKVDVSKMLQDRLSANTQAHKDLHVGVAVDMGSEHRRLLVGVIEPSRLQARRQFDPVALQELADTIEANGLIEPIVVRPHPSGATNRFELIAGERRWRAHQMLKKVSIEAIVVHRTDEEVARMVLVENMQREDLTDYEVGLSLAANMDQFDSKMDMSKALGMPRQELYRYLAFGDLPAFIRADLDKEPGLLGRTAAEELKKVLAKQAFDEGMVRDVWSMVREGRLQQKELASAIERLAEGGVGGADDVDGDGLPPLVSDEQTDASPSPVAVGLKDRRLAAIRSTKQVVKMNWGGKPIGTFSKDPKNLVIRLKSGLLPADKEVKLQRFMEELFSEEE